MLNEQVRQFIDQATQSIQAGQFEQALQLVDQALTLDPTAADAFILKGIGLSQTGQPAAATDAFRRAVELDPTSAKAHYNLAVHLYSQGQKMEALQSARTAVSMDQNHAASRQLVTTIETEMGTPPSMSMPNHNDPLAPQAAPVEMPRQAPPAPFMQANTNPYMKQDVPYSGHSIPFVEKMGPLWTTIGWLLALLSLAGAVGAFYLVFSAMGQVNQNSPTLQEDLQIAIQRMGGLVILVRICGFGSWIGIIAWSIMDHLDQRNSFVWLFPNIICSCCGCGFITLPIYMLAGRNKQSTSNV